MATPQYLERMQRRNYMDRSAFVEKPAPPPYSSNSSKASGTSSLTSSLSSRAPTATTRSTVPPPEYTREIENLQAQLMRSCIVEDRTNVGLDFDGKKEDRVLRKLLPRRFFGGGGSSSSGKKTSEKPKYTLEDWQSGKASVAQTTSTKPDRPYTSAG